MIYLFNIVQLFKDFNFEFIRETLESFILSTFYANDFEIFKALVFGNMSSSKLKGTFGGGGSDGFLVDFGDLRFFCLFRNCSGGSIIRFL